MVFANCYVIEYWWVWFDQQLLNKLTFPRVLTNYGLELRKIQRQEFGNQRVVRQLQHFLLNGHPGNPEICPTLIVPTYPKQMATKWKQICVPFPENLSVWHYPQIVLLGTNGFHCLVKEDLVSRQQVNYIFIYLKKTIFS